MNRSSACPRRLFARLLFVACCVTLLASAPRLRAANDEERAANLQEQIRTLTVVVDAAKTPAEKTRLGEKLQRLQDELTILQSRQALEAKVRALASARNLTALEALHEKLRGITATTENANDWVRQLTARNRQVVTERDALQAQADAGRGKLTPDRQAELDERIFTRNEELRALALEREAADADGELAHDADLLRERLKAGEAARARSTVRGLFEAYTQLRDERKVGDQLAVPAANLEQSLAINQSSLDLAQQKLARFDEELALLEKQTGFFNRDARVETLLAEQRSQKAALGERVPFLARQVEAIKHALRALKQRQESQELAVAFHSEQWIAIKTAYLRRLRWPVAALVGLVLIHLLTGYVLLPLVSKNETLFLLRRLVRYGLALTGAAVMAGFLIDDLSTVAATLGVVSAALVISLQDVCTSIAAWFVIMAGGKFSIGDRLEIDGTRGDVLDIQLLRTTLLELNSWLGVDQPTGRVMVIPNNFIFKTKVFNFNHGHPFVWSKIDLTVTFATPVANAQALFMSVLEDEAAPQFAAAQDGAGGVMLKRYGVDESDFKPKIYTAIADSGVTLTLLFVTHYREVSSTRSRINRRLIAELEKHRDIQLAFHTVSVLHETPKPGTPAAVFGTDVTVPPPSAKFFAQPK